MEIKRYNINISILLAHDTERIIMGKINKIAKYIGRAAAVAVVAFAVMAVPASDIGQYAGATDFDALIAEQDKLIEQLQKENKDREEQIYGFTGDIAENEQAIELITQQIEGVSAEIAAYGEKITLAQDKIAAKEIEIINVENDISDKEKEIAAKREEIADLEIQNEQNLEKFAKLIRALYMNDASDSLPILNGSDDWYDFFTYGEIVQDISSQNLNFMNDLLDAIKYQEGLIVSLNDDIAKLNAEKSDLQDKKTALEAELADLEQKKAEVQAISDEKYADLYDYTAYNENLKYKITSLRSEMNATQAEIDAANEEVEELIRLKQLEASGGPVYSSDGFRWPLDTKYQRITTYFGYDAWRGGNHYGIDIASPGIGGANIYAAQSGTVITAYNNSAWNGGYGNYVVIDHGGGLSTLYAHCVSTTVVAGQTVRKGDVIGYVGTTGWSTGNHLHFETRVYGVAGNPFNYAYEYV